MNKKIVRAIAQAIFKSDPRPGRCYRCQRIIDERSEFLNAQSRTEWRLSHLCQQCQDWAFQEELSSPDIM
jgi:hypothetical protein